MIEYWAVIGLAAIDKNFFDEIWSNVENENYNGVIEVLSKNKFRVSIYEAGEIIRIFKYKAVRDGLVMVQDAGWEHGRRCWTASSESGFYWADESYKHPFVESKNGVSEIFYKQLNELPKE